MSETREAVLPGAARGNGSNGHGRGAERRSRRSQRDELEEIQAELSRPLVPEAVDFMVNRTVGGAKNQPTHAIVVPYLQRQAVEDRLDDVVHPDEWEATYPREDDRGVLCRLVVLGVPRESYGEGQSRWSQEANAFKRAARLHGLGRYLVRMRPMRIPIGPGPLQVQRSGRGYALPEELVEFLRRGYRERVEKDYVPIYGEIVEVSGYALGSYDEGEDAAVGREVQQGAGEPAAQAADKAPSGVPQLVAESKGPGADRGSSGAPPTAIKAVKQAARDAGLTLAIAKDVSRLLVGKATIDRLETGEASELAAELARIGEAKIPRADVVNAVSRAIKSGGEREEKAERFKAWVAKRLAEAKAKGEQPAGGSESAAADEGGAGGAEDESAAS